MSESSSEGGEGRETPEKGLISDEELPEDLQPRENPLARDPGDEPDEEESDGESVGKVEGMPDMGDPGA